MPFCFSLLFNSLLVLVVSQLPDKVPDNFNLLSAVSAGLVRRMDNDFLYKLIFVVWGLHIYVGRISTKMFSGVALCSHDRADFLACIACVKIVEQLTERGEIVVALVTVYSVIDCDIANITLGKEIFGVVANFQLITPHAGHILDDNRLDLSDF